MSYTKPKIVKLDKRPTNLSGATSFVEQADNINLNDLITKQVQYDIQEGNTPVIDVINTAIGGGDLDEIPGYVSDTLATGETVIPARVAVAALTSSATTLPDSYLTQDIVIQTIAANTNKIILPTGFVAGQRVNIFNTVATAFVLELSSAQQTAGKKIKTVSGGSLSTSTTNVTVALSSTTSWVYDGTDSWYKVH